MKTLYLVRHSKSSWEDQTLDDFDRPLKSSGIQDAYMMGSFIKSKGINPGYIISSPAARAINTAIIFATQLYYPTEKIRIYKKLYESTPEDILEVIEKEVPNDVQSVMVFAHDPSLTRLYTMLTGRAVEKIPTSTVVGIELPISAWKEIRESKGETCCFDRPKEVRPVVK
jgi:phosphohistidine phosphatase